MNVQRLEGVGTGLLVNSSRERLRDGVHAEQYDARAVNFRVLPWKVRV